MFGIIKLKTHANFIHKKSIILLKREEKIPINPSPKLVYIAQLDLVIK